MGKTLLELFENKDSYVFGTNYSEVKSKNPPKNRTFNTIANFAEQEIWGIRIKSAVELNNPLIYGNEATRIAIRSTPLVEDMKGATGGEGGDGGLIGKGLEKITGGKFGKAVFGGKVSSLSEARNGINTKLGIPQAMIPTRLIGDIKGLDSQEPITLDSVGSGLQGNDIGKFLKQTGGGSPKTILKQGAGKLIGKAKDKLRGALFGTPQGLGDALSKRGLVNDEEEPIVQFTTNEQGLTYSEQKRDAGLLGEIQPNDLKGTKLDLSKVSPLYGVKREDGLFGKTQYGFINKKNSNGRQSWYSPLDESGNPQTYLSSNKNRIETDYGFKVEVTEDGNIHRKGDSINQLSPSDDYKMDDNQAFAEKGGETLYDFIPVWFKKYGADKPVIFRALISGLTENVSPSWSTSKFVGNPYNFYTFDSIERNTSFNLKLYCNNSAELAINWEKITKLTQITYPSIGAQFANAPIIQFRVGDIYNGKVGYIDSLTYTIPDESNWETDGASGYLPKIIDVALSIKFIESVGAEDRPYAYTITKAAAKAINDKRQANADKTAQRTAGDGSINQLETLPKVQPKGITPFTVSFPKPATSLSGIKIPTPAAAESAKLPDDANKPEAPDDTYWVEQRKRTSSINPNTGKLKKNILGGVSKKNQVGNWLSKTKPN